MNLTGRRMDDKNARGLTEQMVPRHLGKVSSCVVVTDGVSSPQDARGHCHLLVAACQPS